MQNEITADAAPPEGQPLPGEKLDAMKMPGHWLLARMGKRVLRPGGIELTRLLLDDLKIAKEDTVVELAPGLGTTARMVLGKNPARYIGVERDAAAAQRVRRILRRNGDKCVLGGAADTGLESAFAEVVYGEAMLSMQSAEQKARIFREALRVLRPGGRYGIHELCLQPADLSPVVKEEILKDLSGAIHVGVRPLTAAEWRETLESHGFEVEAASVHAAPMHLLEPRRMIADEGLRGALRIAFNVLRNPAARKRILRMRSVFRRHRKHLCAVSIVSRKPGEGEPG